MNKKKSSFECSSCGAKSPVQTGRCLKCGSWGSVAEVREQTSPGSSGSRGLGQGNGPQILSTIEITDQSRLSTAQSELDRVLGGGLVKGSLTLIGGDPGIGKSTLLLQTLCLLSAAGVSCLYVSGEESPQQIALRAKRLGMPASKLPVLCETNIDVLMEWCQNNPPQIMVVDSIQTLYRPELPHSPGAEVQLREITLALMVYAKTTASTVILVGHVTKSGAIAGPKLIEHMVDTVIYFEGEAHSPFRLLRSIKNRFGATHEIGVFEMRGTGLISMENPSQLFSTLHSAPHPGTITTCNLEGTRPILVEIQALVNRSSYSQAQRVAMGLDSKRLHILLALLEKYAGIEVGLEDVFISAAGGFRISEPASDLALAAAVASSHLGVVAQPSTLCIGELSLSGELRPVSQWEVRIREATRMGYTRIIFPSAQHKKLPRAPEGVNFFCAQSLQEALKLIWG